MSSRTIELFRQYTEKQRHEAEEPKQKSQAQEESEHSASNLIVEMSRIEHEVWQLFDSASPAERDRMICFLEVLVRNLKRQADNE